MSPTLASVLVRAAAFVHAATGAGSVASMLILIAVAIRDGRLPVSHGIRWLDGGPFGRLGFGPVLALAGAFAVLGTVETVVGRRLWRDGTRATRKAVAVNVLGIPFWIGFDLPFPPPIAAIRLLLLWGAGPLTRRIERPLPAGLRREGPKPVSVS